MDATLQGIPPARWVSALLVCVYAGIAFAQTPALCVFQSTAAAAAADAGKLVAAGERESVQRRLDTALSQPLNNGATLAVKDNLGMERLRMG